MSTSDTDPGDRTVPPGRGRRRSTTLRRRILRATALLASIALVLAVGAFGITLDTILSRTATESARTQADAVADQLTGTATRAAHRTTDVIDDAPTHGSLIQVLDSDRHVLAGTEKAATDEPLTTLDPPPGGSLATQVASIPSDIDKPYAVVAVKLATPTPDGARTVVVLSPLEGATKLVRLAIGALAVLAVLLLSGLLLLIDRVLRSALGSVEEIRASVDAIRSTDLTARVPVPEGGDEISRLAITMNSMLDRLDRADATQRAFVSDASHELRSPLTTIRMVTELSPDGLDAEGTAVVAAEAQRMQTLVENLLTLAKADDQGLRLAERDVDLDDIVLAEARRVRASTRLDVDARVEAARVTGDEDRLRQVVHNLVDNGMRHAATGMRLTCRLDGGQAVIDVDNDGPPVPVELRERVFERFARLQDSRDRDSGGSGLGLAIVQALARAHGGDVVATEAPDGWCRFRVTLPAQEPPADDDIDDDIDDELDGTDD